MSNVQVSIRLRPCKDSIAYIENTQISIYGKSYNFPSTSTLYNVDSTQEDVFVNSVQPVIDRSLEGYNSTVMVYGQTGSGKTYTMGIGLDVITEREYGIVLNSLEYIFNKGEHSVSCTFIEIYNENVYDLLNKRNKLVLREISNEVIVCGVSDINLNCMESAKELIKRACLERTTKNTKMNNASSRSHAIFTVTLTKNIDDNYLVSKINFVDLAGSERIKKSGVIGEKVKEAININQGLLSLGNVINALYHRDNHIPYRSSKITRILRSSLGGNSSTLFIACINPSNDDISETQNTLKYALRTTSISNKVERNKEIDKNKICQTEQANEIRRLKQENIFLKQQIKDYQKFNNQVENKENKILEQKIIHLEKIINEYKNTTCKCMKKNIDNKNNNNIIEHNNNNTIQHSNDIKNIDNDNNNNIKMNIKTIQRNNEMNIKNKRKVSFNLEEKVKFIKKEDKIRFLSTNKIPIKNNLIENNFKDLNEQKENYNKDLSKNVSDININLYRNIPNKINDKKFTRNNEDTKNNILNPTKKIQLNTVISLEDHRNSISEVLFNNHLYSSSLDGSVRKWDLDKNKSQIMIEEKDPIKNISGKDKIYYSCKNKIGLLEEGKEIFKYSSDISNIFIEDNLLFCGHEDGCISMTDIRKGMCWSKRVHRGTVFKVLKYNNEIFSCSRDHSVGVSEGMDGIGFRMLKPPHYDSVHVLLESNGCLITGGRDCSLKKWNINSGLVQKTIPYAHDSWIRCGYKLEDGFCTGAKDGSMVFWDVDKSITEKYKFYVDGCINSIVENNYNYFVGCQNKKIYVVR
ncbi:Kinesin family protein [Spraguea lophii 42_110]|uniref:Kinesin-like protein n=1 Tax=Spraguea lophii (strain 42_110) TaxID=1358809 RepID=S7W8S7_SPRLO|nr:Kinesin family protein [Spraguea lophii 42_110]